MKLFNDALKLTNEKEIKNEIILRVRLIDNIIGGKLYNSILNDEIHQLNLKLYNLMDNITKQKKWDIRYINLGKHILSWSDDISTQTSAIIVNENHRIISIGYNGFPSGVSHNNERQERPQKYNYIEHAERNAIYNTNSNLNNATLYSVCSRPLAPCADCVRAIIQKNIKRVVCHKIDSNDEKWSNSNYNAITMLKEANINVEYIEDIIDNYW